jgi:uncharacterized integral membrane protein
MRVEVEAAWPAEKRPTCLVGEGWMLDLLASVSVQRRETVGDGQRRWQRGRHPAIITIMLVLLVLLLLAVLVVTVDTVRASRGRMGLGLAVPCRLCSYRQDGQPEASLTMLRHMLHLMLRGVMGLLMIVGVLRISASNTRHSNSTTRHWRSSSTHKSWPS